MNRLPNGETRRIAINGRAEDWPFESIEAWMAINQAFVFKTRSEHPGYEVEYRYPGQDWTAMPVGAISVCDGLELYIHGQSMVKR